MAPEQKKGQQQPTHIAPAAKQPEQAKPELKPVEQAKSEQPTIPVQAKPEEQPPKNKYESVAAAIAAALQKTEAEAEAKKTAAPAADGAAKPKTDRWPDRIKKSTVQNPVQFVWNLADEMKKADPQVRRTDVIKAAIAAGVAGYTARTQYQAWYQEQRNSQRQAALAAAKQAEAAKAAGGRS